MAQAGDILEGKYEILKQIGAGGMSKVYLAMDLRLNKQWAIKEVRRRGTDPRLNEEAVNAAIVEANMIKGFDHYHIPHINDILEYDEYIYVVMDYVEGETLASIVGAVGPQAEANVIKWGHQIAAALHYLHTRKPPVIYRDMKPSNVMIKPDGDIKLIDFGIARTYKERNYADTTILGTVGYAPPEQFGGAQTDARADIYSLGATLFHAVTGIGPRRGEAFLIRPIRDINPSLSGGLEKIICKCTRQDPDNRYQNTSELIYDLEHYREIDDDFLARQKTKLRVFIIFVVLAIVSAAIGVAALVMSAQAANMSYDNNMAWAAGSHANTERVHYYQQAIDIKPSNIEPYIGIINVYKADTCFNVEEEKELMNVVMPRLSVLQNQPNYPDLAFELGKLYWYYYDYGNDGIETKDEPNSNQATRMKSSVRWFGDVLDYGDTANAYHGTAMAYYSIGKFYGDIATKVTEASDAGMYQQYWDMLTTLAASTSYSGAANDTANGAASGAANDTANGAANELVSLTFDTIALDAISVYARKFKSDGIKQDDMEALRSLVLADAGSIVPTSDKTAGMKERISIVLEKSSADAIKGAFRADRDYRGLKSS